jgi:hypothetical protein
MNSEIENQVVEWMNIDTQIKQYNDKLKELRDKRTHLEEFIITKTVDVNTPIRVNNGSLKIIHSKMYEPLTFKYLEKALSEMIKNETQVKQIMEYVKKEREIKHVAEIKRVK